MSPFPGIADTFSYNKQTHYLEMPPKKDRRNWGKNPAILRLHSSCLPVFHGKQVLSAPSSASTLSPVGSSETPGELVCPVWQGRYLPFCLTRTSAPANYGGGDAKRRSKLLGTPPAPALCGGGPRDAGC